MIHSAYIQKVNNEIVRYLEKLGIAKSNYNMEDSYTVIYFENNIPCFRTVSGLGVSAYKVDGAISCGSNLDMFFALAALRDDIDYMQWFTNGKNWILCTEDNFVYTQFNTDFKKASIAEVIDHFKESVHIIINQCYEDIQDVHVFHSYYDCINFIYNEIHEYNIKTTPECTKEEIDKELRRYGWYHTYNYYIRKFNE